MTCDAREIANFLLDEADRQGVSLTAMSLIKIIYFCHGWHLAQYDAPLIKNRFEAWQFGPVVKTLYEQFKQNGAQPISGRAEIFDFEKGAWVIAAYNFDEEFKKFIMNIFGAYVGYSAIELSNMTHEAGSPWHQVWMDGARDVRPGMKIANEDIKQHFQRVRMDSLAH